MQIVGHRGAAGLAPENTLFAVRTALDLGVSRIEIDIRQVDNELIVIHDETVNRTTNGKGDIHELGFKRIRRLDAGKGERIPCLAEVLKAAYPKAEVNIEIKDTSCVELLVTQLEVLEQSLPGIMKHTMVSSFLHDQLEKIRTLLPRLRRAPLVRDVQLHQIRRFAALQPCSLNIHRRYVTPEIVNEAARYGMKTFVYTVNKRSQGRKLHHMGVFGIITDRPDIFLDEGFF
ncbi:MAG: glycerophosphoryl diester phosphodiesterase [Chitinivibrionales bacterium]|nr:glycerophosphoryl diester phosphodiesterase [Chitinivibrionales bacterium]